jgi:hypothetical protein
MDEKDDGRFFHLARAAQAERIRTPRQEVTNRVEHGHCQRIARVCGRTDAKDILAADKPDREQPARFIVQEPQRHFRFPVRHLRRAAH